ncbi:MAG: efflux RND transporter periplasmic adaptor subunit [Candidatus Eisenbacteria bacterium]|nr:efflux RND transporter periplasmic adaptor subunit [Candidatus Eisenbacteria bacterium]
MNKKVIAIVAGVVVVGALIGLSAMKSAKCKVESVQLANVRREDVTSRVRAPGKIEPKTQVKVSADIPGKVIILNIKEGDSVKRGQLLLGIDDTQYRSQNQQASAALASAKARVREAESALRVSDANYGRQKALFEQKLLSQAEWDGATNSHEGARVALATAQEEVARAQAAKDASADNLSKCRFFAPFDGVVSALNVEKGEIVITGTMNNPGTQILVVSDLSRMLVRAEVDETDVVDMQIGQKAKISVDAFPDTTFEGTVTEIGNTAKRSSISSVEGQTNFEVKVVFDHQVDAVRPGMTADVDIATGTHEKTLVVPIQAVIIRTQSQLDRAAKKPGQKAPKKKTSALAADEDTAGRRDPEITGVLVVNEGVTKFVPVRTGLASETMIEVTGDLKENDTVVSGPYKALRELKPGAKVKKEQPGNKPGK